jgi:hypothetical protein
MIAIGRSKERGVPELFDQAGVAKFVKTVLFLQAIKMIIQDKYRSSFDYREIIRILQKSSTLEENFLWQSHALGKTIIPIHHFEIDFVTREVVIAYDTLRFKIDHGLPLYVKLDYRSTVFKVSDYKNEHRLVSFMFPKEIKTLEVRVHPRFDVTQKDLSVSLRPSLSGSRELGPQLQVKVLDISETGLGLMVSEQNRSFLKYNRILWLTELGGNKLAHPVLSEIAYMNNEVDSRLMSRKMKELKVGLKLSGFLHQDIFHKLVP